MKIPFFKYQGTGNDFVMIDNRNGFFDAKNNALVKNLCDRRFGIGADGLILLEQNDNGLSMVYFNSDGNEGSMCGNGGRCFVKFASDLGLFEGKLVFDATDGKHDAFIEQGLVHLKMIDVDTVEQKGDTYFMNTGSPHYVQFVKNIDTFPVVEQGKTIRYSERFQPKGTNVNFIEQVDDVLWVRTYERGVEDETYSCGTGVTASVLATSFEGTQSPVKVKTLGGNLMVSYTKENNTFTNVFLIGPAERVFEGVVEYLN